MFGLTGHFFNLLKKINAKVSGLSQCFEVRNLTLYWVSMNFEYVLLRATFYLLIRRQIDILILTGIREGN